MRPEILGYDLAMNYTEFLPEGTIAMKLLDWLRRLGILRFGAEKATYRDARERPMSLQSDGVFNSAKDVIDLDKKAKPATPPPAERPK
jgi:hypothetical protein